MQHTVKPSGLEAIQQTLAFHHVSEMELIYKTKTKASALPTIHHSEEAYQILLDTWDPNKLEFVESMKVLLLNRGSRVLGIIQISTGNAYSSTIDIGQIIGGALLSRSSGIILAHNHPSGYLSPSESDIKVTATIQEAAKLFDIKLNDHIIVGKEAFFSFADEGLLLKK